MINRTVKQPGDRGKVDVRMRAHVHAAAQIQLCRAGLIDENKGADHAAFLAGHGAAHGEIAKIVADGGYGLNDAF